MSLLDVRTWWWRAWARISGDVKGEKKARGAPRRRESFKWAARDLVSIPGGSCLKFKQAVHLLIINLGVGSSSQAREAQSTFASISLLEVS